MPIRARCLAASPLLLAAAVTTLEVSHAHADINGFGNFSNFDINQADAGSAPTVGVNSIRLTSQSPGQSRSIVSLERQNITAFTASYTFRATGTPTHGFGSTFVLHNSRDGHDTVADPFNQAPAFGYGDFFGSFDHSVAVSMEYGSLGGASSSTACYRDAGVGGGSDSTLPVNLFSGNPIDVTLSYDGVLLRESLLDTVTGASFSTSYLRDIPDIVGDDLAYVGFTASTGGNASTEQYFSNFQFHSVPEPASLALFMLAPLLRRR